MNRIHFHADDYGISDYPNKRIEKCIECGIISGISLLPNGSIAQNGLPAGVLFCIHINLVEGKSVFDHTKLTLLTDGSGFFKNSFLQLLTLSIEKKELFKHQIKAEIRAQIEKTLLVIPENHGIGIDSHQHTHMIPEVFQSIMEVIAELNLNVSYLRIPVEPISPFIRHPSLYFTYKPINMLKSIVLHTLFIFSKKTYRRSNIPTQVFFGIILSGNMNFRRVKKLLPDFIKIAERKNLGLEILFHPGGLKDDKLCLDKRKKGFAKFYLSEERINEYECIHSLSEMFNKGNQ